MYIYIFFGRTVKEKGEVAVRVAQRLDRLYMYIYITTLGLTRGVGGVGGGGGGLGVWWGEV